MALTAKDKKELHEVLMRTGGPREVMLAGRVIPEEYKAYLSKVSREERVLELTDVPVRIIISASLEKTEKCPVHINMHGGGFILPQNEDDDLYCAHLAHGIKGIVVDIDYAYSDPHPFPAAFDQCYEVTKWVFANCAQWGGDPARVSIGGHSAGGNLTSAICLKAAQTGDFKACLQVLDYAANKLDYVDDGSPIDRTKAFFIFYSDGEREKLKDPYFSPYHAPDDMLFNQPDALIVSAENCGFTQSNEEYGMRLIHAGSKVTFKHFKESRHGFTVRMLDEWQEAQEVIISAILNA